MRVEPVLKMLRRMRYEESTIERVYEADVYPPIFDFAAWRGHRSRNRYLEHVATLARSYLLRDLSGPLIDVTIIAILVGTYETLQESGAPPFSTWPDIGLSVPEAFHQTSFALSLMLVFRTNSSYARWAEARAAWGTIINYSRDLCRQSVACFPESNDDLRCALGRWIVAFVKTCKLHLREDGSLEADMAGVLKPFEFELLQGAAHRPLKALQVMAEIVASARVDAQTRCRMDACLTQLENSLGVCERIFKNPIPLSYTRHTARFLFFWLCFLPFTLWAKMGWGIVPSTIVISFFLLGIDEIAIQLEEPFGILPLENLCDTVQRNVFEILADKDSVKDMVRRYAANTGAGAPPEGWRSPPGNITASSDEDDVVNTDGLGVVAGPHTILTSMDFASSMASMDTASASAAKAAEDAAAAAAAAAVGENGHRRPHRHAESAAGQGDREGGALSSRTSSLDLAD